MAAKPSKNKAELSAKELESLDAALTTLQKDPELVFVAVIAAAYVVYKVVDAAAHAQNFQDFAQHIIQDIIGIFDLPSANAAPNNQEVGKLLQGKLTAKDLVSLRKALIARKK
jgi:hypothetical protein